MTGDAGSILVFAAIAVVSGLLDFAISILSAKNWSTKEVVSMISMFSNAVLIALTVYGPVL